MSPKVISRRHTCDARLSDVKVYEVTHLLSQSYWLSNFIKLNSHVAIKIWRRKSLKHFYRVNTWLNVLWRCARDFNGHFYLISTVNRCPQKYSEKLKIIQVEKELRSYWRKEAFPVSDYFIGNLWAFVVLLSECWEGYNCRLKTRD